MPNEMQRVLVSAVGGMVLGVAVTLLVFFVRPHRSWQEEEAHAVATSLACNRTVGLGVRPCQQIRAFRSDGPDAWRIRIEGPGRRQYCYELRTFRRPQRRACH